MTLYAIKNFTKRSIISLKLWNTGSLTYNCHYHASNLSLSNV